MTATTLFRTLMCSAVLFSINCSASTLIQNVRVFDGNKVLTARHVLIDQGKIVDANFKGSLSPQMRVINATGKTLLPGLIDAHVHAFQDQDLSLLFGVTTQIDMFTNVPTMQEIQQRMAQGKNTQAADMIAAGTLATAPKGHGTQYGMEIETLTSPEQAQPWVDKRLAEGSQFIKIVMENGDKDFRVNALDIKIVKALIQATHARQKLAVVHIGNFEDARAALAAGADGLVHLYTANEISAVQIKELVKLAKARGAFIIPTFSVLESAAGMKAQDLLDDTQLTALLNKSQMVPLNNTFGKQTNPEKLTAAKQLTAAFHGARIPVLAGTDAGNTGTQYGISMHREMAALVDAGLSPIDALRSATSVPAKAFRLKDRGMIAAGYKADLLLVDSDPTKDIHATRRIVEVWKDGEVVSPMRSKKLQDVAQEKASKQVLAALPADGRISQFSAEKLASSFGFGWYPSNDAPMGGQSSVQLQVAEAEPSGQISLKIQASIKPGFAYPWAGVVFFPGEKPMMPADLSHVNTLQFKVKGDGAKYQVGFTMQGSFIPSNVTFTATSDWQEVRLPFSQFKGLDSSIVTMLSFNAGPAMGDYQFQIADVRLVKE